MRLRFLPFLAGLGLLFPVKGFALILTGNTGSFNTTNPNPSAPASGWNNVAWNGNDASAVYLGGGWVLTAAHVGAYPISFTGDPATGPGPVYSVVPGSAVTLTNDGASGRSANTDLIVYQINGDPGLPGLTISSGSPVAGSAITIISTGRDRVEEATVWDVNTATNPDTWTTPATTPLPDYTGYAWSSTRTKRWGTNNVVAAPTFANFGTVEIPVDVRYFRSNFTSGNNNEAQGARGDSGSGVFLLNDGNWELAGITIAVGGFDGQPAGTAVFGNETYYADLSFYRPQILAIIPEPGSAALGSLALLGLLRRRRA